MTVLDENPHDGNFILSEDDEGKAGCRATTSLSPQGPAMPSTQLAVSEIDDACCTHVLVDRLYGTRVRVIEAEAAWAPEMIEASLLADEIRFTLPAFEPVGLARRPRVGHDLPNSSILDGYVRQRPTRAPSSSHLQYRIPKSTAIDYPEPRAVVVVEAQPFDFVA